MDITILSENQISTYSSPGTKVQQSVITYQSPGLAPRTIWVNSDQLPDLVFTAKNPGKPVPAAIQTAGDQVRRTLIEADISKIAKFTQARKI